MGGGAQACLAPRGAAGWVEAAEGAGCTGRAHARCAPEGGHDERTDGGRQEQGKMDGKPKHSAEERKGRGGGEQRGGSEEEEARGISGAGNGATNGGSRAPDGASASATRTDGRSRTVSCLTVGDGDLSYSLALCRRFGRGLVLTASTLCTRDELVATYAGAPHIVAELERAGATIAFRVDATNLQAACVPLQDHVVFNHPHLGLADDDDLEERRRRHICLIAHFFASAAAVLARDGLIHLTLCGDQRDSWLVDASARRLGLRVLDCRPVVAPPLYGRVVTGAAEPRPEWKARRRFRDGSLGSRHALAAYGYEHRRTDGDGDVRSDRSIELVLAREGECLGEPVRGDATIWRGNEEEHAPAFECAEGEGARRCPVCALAFDDAARYERHAFELSRPVVWGRPLARTATPSAAHSPAAAATTLRCEVCAFQFPSRNKLFAHLRAGCVPNASDGAASTKRQRLLLLAGYCSGDVKSHCDVSDVHSALVAAWRRAWGSEEDVGLIALVQTERGAHALCNSFVLTVSNAGGSTAYSAAALREALPPSIWVLADPMPVAAGGPLDHVRRAVRRQIYRYALPYSALGAHHWAMATTAVPSPESRVWLTLLPEPCDNAALGALLSGRGIDAVQARLSDCGGFAELELASADSAAAATVALDGFEWRGCRLLAMPLPEAAAKLEAHRRLKTLSRRLLSDEAGHARNYGAFVSERWRKRNAHELRLAVSCHSSLSGDIRAVEGSAARRWEEEDWVVLELGAAEFGAEQVRRIAGAIIHAMRLHADEARCAAAIESHFERADAPMAPLAPVEPMWLHGLVLAGGSNQTGADEALKEEARRTIERAVLRAGRAPMDEFLHVLDTQAGASALGKRDAAGAGVHVVGASAGVESAYSKLRRRLMEAPRDDAADG